MASGSWLVLEELLERGDAAFVDAVRACEDAKRLAAFGASWLADRRPAARRLLLQYLLRPLNAYHHEGLVKRLFKAAEKAGDDEVLAHFLVLFDRSMRRRRKQSTRYRSDSRSSQTAAEDQERQWQAEGAERTGVNAWSGTFHVWGSWPEERLVLPRAATMPREIPSWWMSAAAGEKWRRRLQDCRLFSAHTRHYLRRRAWRYFRNLAATAPERYVGAVAVALKLYEDSDAADGLALLDNWGLVHILFHGSPALWPRSHGWTLHPGHTLGELAPAPAFPELWRQAPAAILDLLLEARCRPVRQWALFFLRQDPTLLDGADIDFLLQLLQSPEPEAVALAAHALENRPGLDALPVDRWLRLLHEVPPTALDAVCALVKARVAPANLTLEQIVQTACNRPVPVARLGWHWLQERITDDTDWALLLRVTEAEAASVRPEIVRWLRTIRAQSAGFDPHWVLDFLDSRHADVRAEGWTWLLAEPRAGGDGQLWQRLFESPYDDVRAPLIAYLENRAAGRVPALPRHVPLDPDSLRLLWATVLLNIHRGSRTKPQVVEQIVRRVTEHPEDAAQLLPVLRIALRSVRGPEWRLGLSGVVRLYERRPELAKMLQEAFPELQLVNEPA